MNLLRLHLASAIKYHVIAVSETWLHSNIPDSFIELPEYNCARHDRIGAGSGGVCLYIHKSLSFSIISTSIPGYPKPEFMLCEVWTRPSNKILIGAIYRTPKSPPLKEDSELLQALGTHSPNYSHKFIMGDFNINILADSSNKNILQSFADSNGLSIVDHGVTHETQSSNTFLDLTLIDSSENILNSGKSDTPFIAGHFLTHTTANLFIPHSPKVNFSYRPIKSMEPNSFNESLSQLDWLPVQHIANIDKAVQCLEENIFKTLNVHAPIKIVKSKTKFEPWITSELQMLLANSNKLYRKFKRKRTRANLLNYRQARDFAFSHINAARNNYYKDRLVKLKDSKQLWKELQNLGLTETKKIQTPIIPLNELNEHYLSVSDKSASPPLDEVLASIPSQPSGNKFTFLPISIPQLTKAVNSFSSEALGVDAIPLQIIKISLPTIGEHTCSIFNYSIKHNVYPDRWKDSIVVPIPKIAKPSCSADYRPISLLCMLSKIFEKLLHGQIMHYLCSNNLLDPFQSGFRPGYSTQGALLKIADDIKLGISNRLLTAMILFDFSKAFDCINHSILLKKLAGFGFSSDALKWVASYLSGRRQCVDANSERSEWRAIKAGVPQGSVLGPLFFILLMNDIGNSLSFSSRLLYADDLQIYIQFPLNEMDQAIQNLQTDIAGVMEWSARNSLRLNLDKTNFIIFGSRYFVNQAYDTVSEVKVDNISIPLKKSVKNLGVWMDNLMSWDNQISQTCKKVNYSLYKLRLFRPFTDLNLRKHLITSLVFPSFDYACAILAGTSCRNSSTLQVLQNNCVRYVSGASRWERISCHRRSLGWITAEGRRMYLSACSLYNILNSGSPSYLASFFKFRQPLSSLRKNAPDLDYSPKEGVAFNSTFHIKLSQYWNNLPTPIRQAQSLPSFKNQLLNHIISQEDPFLPSHL